MTPEAFKTLASEVAKLSDAQVMALLAERSAIRLSEKRAKDAARSRASYARLTLKQREATLEPHASLTSVSRQEVSPSPSPFPSSPAPSSPYPPTPFPSVPPAAAQPETSQVSREQVYAVFVALNGTEKDADRWLAEGGDTSGGLGKIRGRARTFLRKLEESKPSADPRFRAVTDGYAQAYQQVFRAPYVHQGGRDGQALRKFLSGVKPEISAEDIVKVMDRAMRKSLDKFAKACKGASTLAGFCAGINEIRAELQRPTRADDDDEEDETPLAGIPTTNERFAWWGPFKVWAATHYPSLPLGSGPTAIPSQIRREFMAIYEASKTPKAA